ACEEPQSLFEFLGACGCLTDRKARLIVTACSRHIWELVNDQRGREAVEVADRYADGEAGDLELLSAAREANEACYSVDGRVWDSGALSVAHLSTYTPHTLGTFTTPPARARPTYGGYGPEAFAKPENFAILACIHAAGAVAQAAGASGPLEWE